MRKMICLCDLCGKQTEAWMAVQVEEPDGAETQRDICPECVKKIAAQLPKEEPKPKRTTAKKEAPVRQKVDRGKVIALAKAGWSITKIADEMGCSDQTVRNIFKVEREKEAQG